MASKQWLTGTAGALALAAMTGAAQSASLGSMITDFRPTTASSVEKAQYRICAMENGVRRCRMAEISGPYGSTSRRVYGYRPTGPCVRLSAEGSRVRLSADRPRRVRLSGSATVRL